MRGAVHYCLVALGTAVVIGNQTHEPIELQIFRPRSPLDCDAVSPEPEAVLGPDDFAPYRCSEVEPTYVFPLDIDATSSDDGVAPKPVRSRHCDAVLLRAKGLDDTVLFWGDVAPVDLDVHGIPRDDPHVAYVNRVGERLFIEGPDVATRFTPDFDLPPSPCTSD